MQVGPPYSISGLKELIFNTDISSAREAIEGSYKNLKQQFTSKDFRTMLRVGKGTIGLMYRAAAVMWNAKMCLNGGEQATSYFKCSSRQSRSTSLQ